MKFIFSKILKRNFCRAVDHTTQQTDVCIIGGGSVGLSLSTLLTKYNIDNVIIEKECNVSDHPKAHYLSPRTIEIMNYFDTFKSEAGKSIVENNINNVNNWSHYRYCGYLLDRDSYLGEIDHFNNDTQKKLKYVNEISNAYPMHIGQNKLNRTLYNNLQPANKSMIKGQNFEYFEFNRNERLYEVYASNIERNVPDTNAKLIMKSKVIVGCDGSHSKIRKLLDIKAVGSKSIQSFVNAHFFSADLALRLKELNKQSMLHFIFNPNLVCVLISYDIDKGEFVMQIPYSTQIEKEDCFDEKECRKIINMMLSSDDERKRSVKIMKNVVVDKWYRDRIFLIGDAAHQYPPSGGYGLNTGITDAFSLAWMLKYILSKRDANVEDAIMLRNEEILKNNFENERVRHSTFMSKCAQVNYDKFLESCRSLGLNIQHMNILEKVVKNVVPSIIQRSVFNKLINAGIYLNNMINSENLRNHLKNKQNHIQLIFPYLDYNFNFKSDDKNDILKFESMVSMKEIEISVGMVIPNYLLVDQKIRLRSYLKEEQDKFEFPLFFVLFSKRNNLPELKKIKIFDGQIDLEFFKYKPIYLKEDSQDIEPTLQENQVQIEELKKYNVLVIRPDFIIEYIR